MSFDFLKKLDYFFKGIVNMDIYKSVIVFCFGNRGSKKLLEEAGGIRSIREIRAFYKVAISVTGLACCLEFEF